ncbi:UNVERIFIED_CONTAM: Inosine triphosphate pyrophosphatase [Sesamum latifolium]|uniref:Inosine triphosphate pyrophosphatase n=1 Tax=Sesamum latifolium TaxID=2727402 RepID=A0AAW2VTK0_9LAMI
MAAAAAAAGGRAMVLSQPVTFVTGNAKKLEEVRAILGNSIPFRSLKLDLPELQGEPEEISKEKARLAAKEPGLSSFPYALQNLNLKLETSRVFCSPTGTISVSEAEDISNWNYSLPNIHAFHCFLDPAKLEIELQQVVSTEDRS